jgi:hypothetical protein
MFGGGSINVGNLNWTKIKDNSFISSLSVEFCCKPFAGGIRNHLPPPMGRELLDHIVKLIQLISDFPRILNRDLRSVLRHACVSSPNSSASNVFISDIPYPLDCYRQFITPAYAIFFRISQRIYISTDFNAPW